MNKTKIIDLAIIIILFIGISTFPVGLIVKDLFWYYVIESLLMVAVLLFIFLYMRRHPYLYPERNRFRVKALLLLLPSVLIVGSNFYYALILKEPLAPNFEAYHGIQIIFIIASVVVEEMIFRLLLLGNLTHENKMIRIVISAGIFAACHLTHFFSTFNPTSLVIVAYAFGLGMVLGMIYCYSNSFISCIVLHLLFNLVNDFLFERLFGVSNLLWYYLINVFVALIIGLYLLAVYLLKLRKNPVELG